MPLDTTLILVALIIMFASAIKITFGIGFALIGTPLLLLIMEPDRVVGFIAPLILLQDLIILSQTWRYVPWRHAALLAVAASVVAPFAAQLQTVLDPRTLQITISSIIILVGLALLAGVRLNIRRESVAMVAGGCVSGLLFPLSGISGPPVALLLVNQRWPVQTMRAVLAAYLVVLEMVTLVTFRDLGGGERRIPPGRSLHVAGAGPIHRDSGNRPSQVESGALSPCCHAHSRVCVPAGHVESDIELTNNPLFVEFSVARGTLRLLALVTSAVGLVRENRPAPLRRRVSESSPPKAQSSGTSVLGAP